MAMGCVFREIVSQPPEFPTGLRVPEDEQLRLNGAVVSQQEFTEHLAPRFLLYAFQAPENLGKVEISRPGSNFTLSGDL